MGKHRNRFSGQKSTDNCRAEASSCGKKTVIFSQSGGSNGGSFLIERGALAVFVGDV